MKKIKLPDYKMIKNYYDEDYYRDIAPQTKMSFHHKRLVQRINICPGQQVLDIGCGTGEWLHAVFSRGAFAYGLDISSRAVAACKVTLPQGKFMEGCAENLPFPNNTFDVVTCLGSLEHFLDPRQALLEMVRVAKDNAIILISVPNAGFPASKLGFFSGTDQRQIREEVLFLEEWKTIFESSGLHIRQRWRDLHILSWKWIKRKGWPNVPIRTIQALLLAVLPLKWQYQVYHLCTKSKA